MSNTKFNVGDRVVVLDCNGKENIYEVGKIFAYHYDEFERVVYAIKFEKFDEIGFIPEDYLKLFWE